MSSTVDMQSIYYTSTDGAKTFITFTQLVATSSQTVVVISVTKEIRPLLPTEYIADTIGGSITLLNELSLYPNETLFVLYKTIETTVPITSLTTLTT